MKTATQERFSPWPGSWCRPTPSPRHTTSFRTLSPANWRTRRTARRLPDCGPGRDEGVDAIILGGGQDGGLAAEAALLHPGPERGPGAGQGQRRHARRARVELGALAAAVLVAIIGEDLVIGAVQELGELRQRLGDNLTRPHRSATQEAGHQVGVAGRGVTLKYVPFNITTDFCK